MIDRPVRAAVVWTLMGMETALTLPAFAHLMLGDGPWGVLGLAVAVAMLPLGYLSARRVPPLSRGRWRLGAGIGLSLGLRLFATVLTATLPDPTLGSIVGWALSTVLPVALGLALWWRGTWLAVTDVAASDVRNEFGVAAAVLIVLLTVFRPGLGADTTLMFSAVLLLLTCGLLAVGMSRQDAAGSAEAMRTRALVLTATLFPLALGLVLAAALTPPVVAAFWQALGVVAGLVVALLAFLLQPLVALLSWWRPSFSPTPLPTRPGLGGLLNLAERGEPPAWLQALVLLVVGISAVVVVVLLVWLLVAIIAPGWFRKRPSARSPVSVESIGGFGQDARSALSGLRGWLARLVSRAPVAGHPWPHGRIRDARAAYRSMLLWARREGVARSPAETTRQLGTRLAVAVPPSSSAVAALTDAYEQERYGAVVVPPDRLETLVLLLRELNGVHRQEAPDTGSAGAGAT